MSITNNIYIVIHPYRIYKYLSHFLKIEYFTMFNHILIECLGFSCGTRGKESSCNAGDSRNTGLIPGWGRSPGEGHGNPFQCSCLENPMDREDWEGTVHGVAKRWTWLKLLSTHALKVMVWSVDGNVAMSVFWDSNPVFPLRATIQYLEQPYRIQPSRIMRINYSLIKGIRRWHSPLVIVLVIYHNLETHLFL